MIGIIIIGHGEFPQGMMSAVELIGGKQEGMQYVNFPETDTATELEKNIHRAIEEFKGYEDIFIFSDLLSGSPFNTAAMEAMRDERIHLYYGVNLGMLLEVVVQRTMSLSAMQIMNTILETGKEQIGIFDVNKIENDEDEFDS